MQVPVFPREQLSNFSKKTFLAHHDTHPLTFVGVLTSEFGPEWILWEPETIKEECEVFGKSGISKLNWEKIQSIRVALSVPSPWKNWSVFCTVNQPINNNIASFITLQQPSTAQCAFTVSVLSQLDDHDYSPDVQKFIAASAMDEGVTYLPPPLNFAQEWIKEPKYKCNSCGWVGEGLNRAACWNCTSADVMTYNEREVDHIKQRYEEIMDQIENNDGDHDLLKDDVPEDVQTAKLLVVHDYLQYRDWLLKEQIRILNVSR